MRGAQHREQAQATIQRITGELTDLTQAAMRAAAVTGNGTRAWRCASGRTNGQVRRVVGDLATIVEGTGRVVEQV